jgi:RNA polymerase sigma factor (sigma-70 family)
LPGGSEPNQGWIVFNCPAFFIFIFWGYRYMNMTYQYAFSTGDVNEVDVTKEMYIKLTKLDNEEQNNDRRNTGEHRKAGRHIQLSALTFLDGNPCYDYRSDFADDTDILADILDKEASQERTAKIRTALAKLKPRQLALIIKLFVYGQKAVDIAREMGISEAAISQSLKKIREHFKKYL